jgi:hypothetical protein
MQRDNTDSFGSLSSRRSLESKGQLGRFQIYGYVRSGSIAPILARYTQLEEGENRGR